MPAATAFVVTSRPERYIKQLVSHFGNKVTTELTDEGGRLQFDFGTCDLKATTTGIEMIGTARTPPSWKRSRMSSPAT
jgi:caffeoyl-CoA O-methyltransferase